MHSDFRRQRQWFAGESVHSWVPTIGPKTSEIFHFRQSKESRLGLNRTRQSRKKTSTLFSPPDFLPSDCAIRIFHPSENHAPNQLAKRTRLQTQNSGCKNLAFWLVKTAKSRKKKTFSRPAWVHRSLRQLNVPNFLSARHNLMFLPEKIEDKDDTPTLPAHPTPLATAASEVLPLPPPLPLPPTFRIPSPSRPRSMTRRRQDSLAPRADGQPSASATTPPPPPPSPSLLHRRGDFQWLACQQPGECDRFRDRVPRSDQSLAWQADP